jgi:hypothetical protein
MKNALTGSKHRKALATVLAGFLTLLLVPLVGVAQEPGGGEDPAAPFLPLAAPASELAITAHGTPDNILMITYDNNGSYQPGSLNVHDTLVALGYTVTHLHHPADGVIATTLAGGTFEQVWVWDINTFLQISAGDAAAIGNWYLLNAQGNIVVDGRSYGAYYNIGNDQFLIENVAHALSSRCGGLWVGGDHAPTWAHQANAVLSAAGYGNITSSLNPGGVVGDYSSATSTEILTSPNVLDPTTLHAYASPGVAPSGVQGDGTTLLPVLRANSGTGPIMTTAALESDFCTIEVSVDIKFCSNPNAFNCKKGGVLPVTIFGTDDFDVTDIDISSLKLCTEDLSACTGAPKDYSIADRGDPSIDLGAAQCAVIEVDDGVFEEQDYLNMDGFLDLDAAFEASEVQAMLGEFCGADKGAVSGTLVLTGTTIDGTAIISVPIGDVGIDQLLKQNR